MVKNKLLSLLPGAFLFLAACQVPAQVTSENLIKPNIQSIYWSDGDSGRATLSDGTVIKFRINDIDAPETGGVGAAIGGAKCEAERAMGYEAKAWAVEFTRGVDLEITGDHGEDRYERKILDLAANDNDIGQAGIEAGVYQSWRHDGKRQLEPRPDWCS